MSQGLFTGLWDLVFPPLCIRCRQFLNPADKKWQLCSTCRRRIVLNRPPFCQCCSRPLPDPFSLLCKTCQHAPRHFDRAWAATLYNEEMSHLLYKFKYGQKTALRHLFAELILSFIETYHLPRDDWDLIIPIPLFPSRQRERGFNQSEFLARLLSNRLAIPLVADHLKRIRPTRFQATLTQKERWTNLEGAFKMKSPVVVAGKNILLIDDLLTTGATTSAAASVLKISGAASVFVLTLSVATEKNINR